MSRLGAERRRQRPATAQDRRLQRSRFEGSNLDQMSRVNRSSVRRSIRSTPRHQGSTTTGGAGDL